MCYIATGDRQGRRATLGSLGATVGTVAAMNIVAVGRAFGVPDGCNTRVGFLGAAKLGEQLVGLSVQAFRLTIFGLLLQCGDREIRVLSIFNGDCMLLAKLVGE